MRRTARSAVVDSAFGGHRSRAKKIRFDFCVCVCVSRTYNYTRQLRYEYIRRVTIIIHLLLLHFARLFLDVCTRFMCVCVCTYVTCVRVSICILLLLFLSTVNRRLNVMPARSCRERVACVRRRETSAGEQEVAEKFKPDRRRVRFVGHAPDGIHKCR